MGAVQIRVYRVNDPLEFFRKMEAPHSFGSEAPRRRGKRVSSKTFVAGNEASGVTSGCSCVDSLRNPSVRILGFLMKGTMQVRTAPLMPSRIQMTTAMQAKKS